MNQQDNSPYAAPQSELLRPEAIEIPKSILKKIRVGWIAALVTGAMTMVIMLIAINMDILNDVFDLWSSIDVLIVFSLAYGIYKKSRIASTVMFVYFLVSKIFLIMETGQPSGLVITVAFIYFYFQAMVATYQYHAFLNSVNKAHANGQ